MNLIPSVKALYGDCLEEIKKIPNGSIDAVVADIPYGTTSCKWDSVIPFEPMWEQLHRVIKSNGAIALFGSEPFASALRMSNIKNYKYDWVWLKSRPTNVLNAKKQPLRNTENISVFYKNPCLYNPQGLMDCNIYTNSGFSHKAGKNSDIYGKVKKERYTQTKTGYPRQSLYFDSEEHNIHPTQKPVPLIEYLIKTYTVEGETVLDFTAGSFTTGIACLNTKRNFIGIEKDAHYFKVGTERMGNHWNSLTKQTF